jgi:hypothetical protein
MKRSALFRLALLSTAVAAIQNANAGSAVAHDSHGHTVYSFGHPKTVAIERALGMARTLGWADARIIAASDVTGYGAIAVARKGNGSVIGAALGRPSRVDAEQLAIEICLKGGGTDPKVRWEWHG